MPQTPSTVLPGFNYKHIATTTTLVVKSAPGVLRRIIINSATSGAVATFYDNTAGSGTVIGVYTFGAAVNAPLGMAYEGLAFATGLTVVVSTQACDLTIIYT